MGMVDRIKSLAMQKGETIASIERACSFGQGSIRKWDNAAPSADKLHKVAQMFGVTMEYLLLGGPQSTSCDSEISSSEKISPEGLQVGYLWESLNERSRTIVLAKIYERLEIEANREEKGDPGDAPILKQA